MTELIVPCPHCQTNLLVDAQNAGQDVLCPGCNARLTLPRELSYGARAVVKALPEAPSAPEPSPADKNTPERKNHPLYRTGHMTALPEDETGAAPAVGSQHRTASLPVARRADLSAEEEMRRLAPLAADPGKYDLHNVDTKGRSAFPCPSCHRPVWTQRQEGQTVVCDACGSTVTAPDASKDQPARVMQAADSQPRQRTVLPGRRQVEDRSFADPPAAKERGRTPEISRGPLPGERARNIPAIEPIPARGDVDLAPTVRKGPPAAKRIGGAMADRAAAAAEFGDASAHNFSPKTGHRVTTEKQPEFSPKPEIDLSVEHTGKWGGEAPQENSPVFRRTLTAAIIILLLAAVGFGGFLLKDVFAPREKAADRAKDKENPVQSAEGAKKVLAAFFLSRTPEEMAKHVRHPEITLPRMQAWYAGKGVPAPALEFTDDWVEYDNLHARKINFLFTSVRLDGLIRGVYLEIPPDGAMPRLDWEHLVAWSQTPWSDFLRTTSETPGEFRLSLTPLDYYNGPYSDRNKYLAFRVSDRENFGSCYAYCEARSELATALLKTVREARQSGLPEYVDPDTGEGIARVILRLHFTPEGKSFNQATIDALVWNDWLDP